MKVHQLLDAERGIMSRQEFEGYIKRDILDGEDEGTTPDGVDITLWDDWFPVVCTRRFTIGDSTYTAELRNFYKDEPVNEGTSHIFIIKEN